jgi:F-type H+-transporting ATPase subunit b
MELSWTTFALEIVNFLILVWILQRFLYKPVLAVIDRRRAGIESVLAEAEAKQSAAQTLKEQYEGRLSAWEQERERARQALADELEQERAQKLAALKDELEQQREKTRIAEAQRQADAQRKTEAIALAQGARFAARLLEQAAGPELQSRLIELAISELGQLSTDQVEALGNSRTAPPDAIVVTTAFPMQNEQKQKLEQALAAVTKLAVPCRFEVDESLVAGISIAVGGWVLAANLRDELRGFTSLANGD